MAAYHEAVFANEALFKGKVRYKSSGRQLEREINCVLLSNNISRSGGARCWHGLGHPGHMGGPGWRAQGRLSHLTALLLVAVLLRARLPPTLALTPYPPFFCPNPGVRGGGD